MIVADFRVYIELVHPGFVPSFWGTVPVGEGDDFRSRPLEQFRKKWRKLVCFKVGEEQQFGFRVIMPESGEKWHLYLHIHRMEQSRVTSSACLRIVTGFLV